MAFYVRLSHFTGPFELLCHLIDRHEIDIYDIPIATITREYLAHLQGLEELDLNDASRFLLLAAQLLRIKSRVLLPAAVARPEHQEEEEGEEEDPREELVQKLQEYRLFQAAAALLQDMAEQEGVRFTRPPFYPAGWYRCPMKENMSVAELVGAFSRMLAQKEAETAVMLAPRRYSVDRARQYLWERLCPGPRDCSFQDLFPREFSRVQVAVAFLALLELWHRGWVEVEQPETRGEIMVRAVKRS